jgi:hypothetical protein
VEELTDVNHNWQFVQRSACPRRRDVAHRTASRGRRGRGDVLEESHGVWILSLDAIDRPVERDDVAQDPQSVLFASV